MQVAYLEMHGAGNRILVVDLRNELCEPPDTDTLRRLGNQDTGPGFDQLMWVNKAADPDNAASYRVFNKDGSEVEQCGNGVRCVARILADNATTLKLESPSGIVQARVLDDGRVSVSMGAPEFEPARIPFVAETRSTRYALDVDGETLSVAAVSMGNPHCVLEVADVQTAEVERLGPLVEQHARFPQKANVGFMQTAGRKTIRLRVYERGVGETRACGTGACAAVVCGQQLGLLDTAVTVHLPGGELVVSWRGGDDPVWLTGNAELVSEGTMDL